MNWLVYCVCWNNMLKCISKWSDIIMEMRKIKDQDVSVLGMGCMRLPLKAGSNEIDYDQTAKMIDLAIKKGITYFDTAYPYHNGESEIVVGKILKNYPRDSFTLATKMPSWVFKTLDDAKRIFNEQLEKCQVEYFDFYLCHAMNLEYHKHYEENGVYEFLDSMRKEGKIRHLGFSYHDAPQNIVPIAERLDWDFAQIQFNYLDYEMQDAKMQYEELTKRGISVVVMEPVRGGLLASLCDEATNLFKSHRPNASMASWALRYVASFPNIKVILSGMSNLEQVEDNLNTFNNYEELTSFEHELVQRAKKAILGNDFIPCTGCRYCMPCPFGVDIPRIFSLYNNIYGIRHDLEGFKEAINKLDDSKKPFNCKKCGKCVSHCPQQIKIFEKLAKISELL